jgi:MFS family permease
MNRNVWLLFVAQSLNNASTIAFVSTSALIGYSLAEDKTLATIPYALQMLATMCASIPAGILFTKLGRKPGFLLGCAGTFIGTSIATIAVIRGDFTLFCLGSIPNGLGFGIGQHYRFAAAEVAGAANRARAISLVMAGGVLAAILGPELVIRTKDSYGPVLFVATYLILCLLPLIGAALVCITKLPPAPPLVTSPTPISTIIARPGFYTAVIAGLVAYGSMNLVMTSTPLEMRLCGFGVDDSTDVIRAHALCMFAPGFFTGRLIQRFGVHRIILVGGLLTLACVALAFSGSTKVDFYAALMVLGLGWNFMFVGATTLLATAHDSAERMRAQAANDFIVFGTVAITAFSSGALHAAQGWHVLNGVLVAPVIIALVLVAWQRSQRARVVAS